MTQVAVTVALTLGFFAGLLAFRIKQRWCADCGLVLRCPQCEPEACPLPVPLSPGPLPGPLPGSIRDNGITREE